MIYIWDNGGKWSDHSITFIETEWPRELVERVCRLSDEEGYLIGAASSFEWFRGEPESLEEQIHFYAVTEDLPKDFQIGVLRHSIAWRRGLIESNSRMTRQFQQDVLEIEASLTALLTE